MKNQEVESVIDGAYRRGMQWEAFNRNRLIEAVKKYVEQEKKKSYDQAIKDELEKRENAKNFFLKNSISEERLRRVGFIHYDKHKYWRDGNVITYNGYDWKYGDIALDSMEHLEKLLSK